MAFAILVPTLSRLCWKHVCMCYLVYYTITNAVDFRKFLIQMHKVFQNNVLQGGELHARALKKLMLC